MARRGSRPTSSFNAFISRLIQKDWNSLSGLAPGSRFSLRIGFWVAFKVEIEQHQFSMTYEEAIQFLYRLQRFGTRLGLENTFKLAELAGHPQNELRFIHVAGTNGKGSTCAMLETIYRSAGLRVGLFTSPHLVAFGERIQVDRHPLTEKQVVRLVLEVQPLLKQFPAEEHPTFFEVV